MQNIPGIISIGYAPASSFSFAANLKPTDTVSVTEQQFTFFEIVPETGEINNDKKESAAGNYFNTDCTFQISPVDESVLAALETLNVPNIFYIKAISGNYLMGLNQEVYPKFTYSTSSDKKHTGFIGATCKLVLISLCGLLKINEPIGNS